MSLRSSATHLTATMKARVRRLSGHDPALARVIAWLRTIMLEQDVFFVDAPSLHGFFRFPFPSMPADRPSPVRDPEACSRVRWAVHSGARPGLLDRVRRSAGPDLHPPEVKSAGWLPILRVRSLQVYERDLPHGPDRPLRLGLSAQEAWHVLAHTRRAAEHFLSGRGIVPPPAVAIDRVPRLRQRCGMAVAIWTRGRLRGSVVHPPGVALRTAGEASIWACQDTRFARLTADDLAQSIFQISLVHAPRVPLCSEEVETADAYPDKAMYAFDGRQAGVYVPEIFNIRRYRTLRALTDSLARDKAGLDAVRASTSFEVCEVSEFVESADRTRAIQLEGPVAGTQSDKTRWRSDARQAGQRACAWLATIQREDGSLPRVVHPLSGKEEGVDLPRAALTAHALAAFGVATGTERAMDVARGIAAWLGHAAPDTSQSPLNLLLTACYRGKAEMALGHPEQASRAVVEVLDLLDHAASEPLVLSHAASFLGAGSALHASAAQRCDALRCRLREAFLRARAGKDPLSLAQWAEVVAAFPAASDPSREVADWLACQQLESGAFPNTTASDFAYTRGTSKILEVLALHPSAYAASIECGTRWLLAMQYRADSMFFIPEEHRARAEGGFRHDMFDVAAWIDSAGHFLLGLARLEGT